MPTTRNCRKLSRFCFCWIKHRLRSKWLVRLSKDNVSSLYFQCFIRIFSLNPALYLFLDVNIIIVNWYIGHLEFSVNHFLSYSIKYLKETKIMSKIIKILQSLTNVLQYNEEALNVHQCPSSSTYECWNSYAIQFITMKAIFFVVSNILIRKYSNKRLLRVQTEVNDVGVTTRQKEQVAARGLRVNWISIEPWRFYLTKNFTEPFSLIFYVISNDNRPVSRCQRTILWWWDESLW